MPDLPFNPEKAYEKGLGEEVGATCEKHGCELSWCDFGDGETGPQIPAQMCPMCEQELKTKCPKCGGALEVSTRWTKNYGGGWDSYEKCSDCDYTEVFV